MLLDPLAVFVSAFGVSAFAGLAALLRQGTPLSIRHVLSAMLYSGLMGLAISLLWYKQFQATGNIWLLIGFCVLAGLGGTSLADFCLYIAKKGGITINVNHDRDWPDRNRPRDPPGG